MMLDTVTLSLEAHEFEVLDPDRFSPSAAGLLFPPYAKLGARGYASCVQNPAKADFEAGRYLPRLTLSKRKVRGGFALTLRTEFSAPKLLFGNNFDELTSRDFDQTVEALQRALLHMFVRVDEQTLRAARVSAIHYSKNIAFTDFTTCSMVMGELKLIDLNGRLDLSHTDYRNEGHAIRYHANSHEVVFYDKLKDLQRARLSEKRGVERDYGLQLGLFEDRDAYPKQLEVLRMEVRLGTRAKIKSVLKNVGADVEPAFAALFDISLAKDVLLRFWAEIRGQLPLAVDNRDTRPEDLFQALATADGASPSPAKLLQNVALVLLARSIGVRGAGALMSRHCSSRSWQRYKAQLSSIQLDDLPQSAALWQVDQALQEFTSIRLQSFRREAGPDSIVGNALLPTNARRRQMAGRRDSRPPYT